MQINFLVVGLTAGMSVLGLNAAERIELRNLSGKWTLSAKGLLATKPETTDMVIEHNGNKFRWTATVTEAGGKQVTQSYDGAVDGIAYPVIQNGAKRAEIAYVTVDPSTVRSISSLPNGKKTTVTHILSEDGKTLTNTSETGVLSVWHKE